MQRKFSYKDRSDGHIIGKNIFIHSNYLVSRCSSNLHIEYGGIGSTIKNMDVFGIAKREIMTVRCSWYIDGEYVGKNE